MAQLLLCPPPAEQGERLSIPASLSDEVLVAIASSENC